ncbi:type II toxin-antitoxin system VapC family toxin [Thiorhodococcus mannitoliphagus]|uniref:Ribonuclease VapC n=1 Tax=Thiorhodococcus mannitoliphagus TaxID=329406 RepID=A0A6P1DZS7_9GAMM|nr:type II toxin-antitoxin system VapC family toxin [Thiorhodococcus mannitoliphagus]NEX21672.1 type II toxin-antitoxin system VapC family toxin [Thiorhodococcus mannitoliphagus]
MVIDSSAMVAVLFGESEAERLTNALAADPVRCISAFSVLETSIVLYRRKGAEAVAELEALLADLGIEIVPFDAIQARAARVAYERFGKGLHPASLNLGDCCSYALASIRKQPLLYKGDDFPQTDLPAVALGPPEFPQDGAEGG